MCMIYKQCNYSILLLLYDFEYENVEIKTNLKLETFICLLKGISYSSMNGALPHSSPPPPPRMSNNSRNKQ